MATADRERIDVKGEYNGISLQGKGCYINFAKDNRGEFEPLTDTIASYFEVAELLAQSFVEGTWGDAETKAYQQLCQLTAADKNVLKGRILVSAFVKTAEKNTERHKIQGTGRHLGLNNEQIESILLNEETKGMTQLEFRDKHLIPPKTYRRVVKRSFTHQEDNARIDQVAADMRLKLTSNDMKIAVVLRNNQTKKKSRKALCKEMNISEKMYYRIINRSFTAAEDNARINLIADYIKYTDDCQQKSTVANEPHDVQLKEIFCLGGVIYSDSLDLLYPPDFNRENEFTSLGTDTETFSDYLCRNEGEDSAQLDMS